MSYNERHSGSSQIIAHSSATTVVAPVIPLALLDAILQNCDRIIVKIDVEGHEVSVLRAIDRAGFSRRVTDLLIEVSTVTGGGAGHAAATREAVLGMGFVERTIPKQGAKIHYDAHFSRERRWAFDAGTR